MAGFSLFTYRTVNIMGNKLPFWESMGLFSFLVATTVTILYFTGYPIDLFSFSYLILLFAFFRWLPERKLQPYKYSTFIVFTFLYALFSTTLINYYSMEKERNHKRLTAVTLSSEHDPVAELLLDRVETRLKNDQEINKYLFDEYFFYEDLYNYLRKKYFNGYWTKYDLQLTLCAPGDSVLIEPDMEKYPCHHFFHDMLEEFAMKLPNCCFYYLDNANGSISYFGTFQFTDEGNDNEVTLYIQLDSKLITAELGYPELLLEDKMLQGLTNNGYSYAKYFDHRLISQTGNFPYSLKDDAFLGGEEEFYYVRFDDFIHLVYRVNESNTIVISSPSVKFIDLLISFSYIFLLYFVLITIALVALNTNTIKRSLQFNFKNRIQFTMISILFLSLLLVGGGTVYYSLQQYKNKHFEILGEKIQSVYIELIHKFELEHEITTDWHTKSYGSLEELLKKFSNVFYTDINLYDKNGNLLATSRGEIFERGLLGEKMHPMAYKALYMESRTEFIHNEKIGGLEYISAYVPFMNSNNQLLAYLNLPYFTKQSLLTREISTLVVTVVNIYVLLILLSIFLAVIISNKITYPLRLLQNKFKKMKLGKKDEPIQYKGDDEIGSLVNEYNRMVKELARSVELLARTEREFAWREMAKQIAHEIKNPLTPMKLSIQQMQRAWNNKDENWEEHLQKVSKTLIEEIENLAQIATEFSNFAKIPKTLNTEFNVLDILDSTLELYGNHKQVEITRDYAGLHEILIFADKEQIRRVFINLISNAIQSIPANKKGEILVKVKLNETKNSVFISFKDNGKGIADEIKDRLFQPNFTTKSSGMGLGLAIVKNIIDNAGGNISYQTQLERGTTFIVEFPIINYK
jgi:signal transduction histidine kinase